MSRPLCLYVFTRSQLFSFEVVLKKIFLFFLYYLILAHKTLQFIQRKGLCCNTNRTYGVANINYSIWTSSLHVGELTMYLDVYKTNNLPTDAQMIHFVSHYENCQAKCTKCIGWQDPDFSTAWLLHRLLLFSILDFYCVACWKTQMDLCNFCKMMPGTFLWAFLSNINTRLYY